jgi:hypothetical protein
MEIIVDGGVSLWARGEVSRIVHRALAGRSERDLRVFVSRPGPARWSVFITGLPEHPLRLTESIQADLRASERHLR